MFLYGIVTSQVIRYFGALRRINESLTFRILFISVFLVDTTYTVVTIYLVWFFAISHYGDPAVLSLPVWPLEIIPISLAWPAFVTQLYFIRRLWRLIPSKILVIFSSVLATSSLLLAAMLTARLFYHRVAMLTTRTGSLTIALLRARTGIIRVDYLIYRFTRGAIQTGLFAGIATLGGLVCFFCARDTSLDLLFGIPTGRVYTLVCAFCSYFYMRSLASSRLYYIQSSSE
ncbi:hypothetical protein CONPUDRAFT_91066 [Coniophora puteana RWD-64-598 SS2]|uniref:Uncharacterized protein n=1 Tax=Coniophora puteana (strain RWD-64-598) TaxID=741705 RepID=A0A5M3MKM8_CONPW|nr:uncharacterized protein CONPUDRAFT_91066 [Coniophora puteana RWD-64-598 SS2]EIW79772.1 hypothetical protein CONPUDRAFT_91066 [Coniophora puteana RWD-64-598 SS2]